jgi:hypothetical protein
MQRILLALLALFPRPVADPHQVAQAIHDYCPGRELLVVAIIRIESPRLDPRAVSSAGALGLTQILCRPGFKRPYCKEPRKLLQTRSNIKAGCQLLEELAKRHERCDESLPPHHLVRHWNWYGRNYEAKVLCALAGAYRALAGVEPREVRSGVRTCLAKLRSVPGSRASPRRASHPP